MTSKSATALSSAFEQEILTFYDQMADLQGSSKNYRTKDADEFCLERELENLKSRTTRSDIYPQPPQLFTTGDIFHTMSTSSYPDIHVQSRIMDEARRARNQEILAKLQELQMNASIFEARSERFRGIRREYEALVQKYSSQRMLSSMTLNDRFLSQGKRLEEDFVTDKSSAPLSALHLHRPSASAGATRLVSTGVNTDLTGPVVPERNQLIQNHEHEAEEIEGRFQPRRVIRINNTRLPPKTFRINETADRLSPLPSQVPLSMPTFFRKTQTVTPSGDGYEDRDKDTGITTTREPQTKKHTHFQSPLDLSTTSDSELDLTVTRDKDLGIQNKHQSLMTLTDDDSISFTVSKTRNPALNLLNLNLSLTDDSDSTISNLVLRKTTAKNTTGNGLVNPSTKKKIETQPEPEGDNIPFRHSNLNNAGGRGQRQGEILSDSPTSQSESFIDSTVQNKTPDSLPRDESELGNIAEEEHQHQQLQDQEVRNDDVDADAADVRQKNDEESSESDPEGTQADVSSAAVSASVKMDGEIMEMRLRENDVQNFQNKVVAAIESDGNLEQLRGRKNSNASAESGSPPYSGKEFEVDKETFELKENEVKEVREDFEETSKGKSGRLKLELEKSLMTATTAAKTESGNIGAFVKPKSGNAAKSGSAKSNRTVRLKLDYEDSESDDGSEGFPVASNSTLTTGNQRNGTRTGVDSKKDDDKGGAHQKNKFQDVNDDYDDFFDI